MAKYRSAFPLEKMARLLGVSKSGFYQFLNRPISARAKEDDKILQEIRQIHRKTNKTYGRPRILEELKEKEISCGTPRLQKIMKQAGISARIVRKFRLTTDSNHSFPISPNLLKRNFSVPHKNHTWVSDITYVKTNSGWLYLCLIIDLYSRRIVGWSMRNHMETSLVLSALRMAYDDRRPEAGLIFHSDRGSQYASFEFRRQLALYGMKSSMSRKADCWDNACAESMFSTLKRELIYRKQFENHADAKLEIFEYIEVFYNRQRRHSFIGYMSPENFEKGEVA